MAGAEITAADEVSALVFTRLFSSTLTDEELPELNQHWHSVSQVVRPKHKTDAFYIATLHTFLGFKGAARIDTNSDEQDDWQHSR